MQWVLVIFQRVLFQPYFLDTKKWSEAFENPIRGLCVCLFACVLSLLG